MTRHSAALIGLAIVGVVALTGCTPGAGTPGSDGSSSHSADASADPSTKPTVTAAPAAPTFALPANCTAIASAATLTALFADIPSRPPGDLTRPAPTGASKLLTCSWFAGDTTGGDVVYYSTTAAAGQAYVAVMQGNGFVCAAALGGTRCDKTTPNTQYPVDTVETTFTRDNVWIYVSMTNVDATALLPDMVATAWAA
ncbi:MAG: hypothetical protein ABIP33_05765 [Pseudolysinimonas sp.]